MGYTNRAFSIAKKSFDDYNLIYLTWSRYENDWPSNMHFHSFTEFMYIAKGEGALLLEGGARPLREGDFAVVGPNTPHTETSELKNSLEYYVFAVENIVVNRPRDEESDPVFICNVDDLDDRKMLLSRLKRAEAELVNRKPYYEVYVQSLINEALVYILRKANMRDANLAENGVPNECAFVKRYIDMHYSEKITLADLAKKTFFSKFYIIHSFKRQYGITPIQYLLDTRLTQAANLLKTTNLSVTNVTTGVGFSSPSQFAKAFKEKYGRSPLSFRSAAEKTTGKLPPPRESGSVR